MDESTAVATLGALAQSTRLAVFRRLLTVFPDGLAAGEIARACGVPHNTMSTHLALLTRTGLVAVRRQGRVMHYRADLDGFRSLVGFLMRDCCNGRAEICAPLLADLECCLAPVPKERSMADRAFNVLFLCTGNSARSIIAEVILNKVGHGKFRAYSAGSAPKGEINPHTIQLLQGLGYDTSRFRSKSWGEFAKPGAPPLDFVFTVCDNAAGETCPVWPGQPMTAHWGVPDPAEAKGSQAEIAFAFDDTYRMLFQRIGVFTALPIRSLDRLSLQARLREIGRLDGAMAKAKQES